MRQVRATAIHQIDTWQTVLHGDFLRAKMLFHRHRIIGSALDGRVVADNHHFAACHTADPGNHAGAVNIAFIHAIGGQRPDLQKRRTRIQQAFHPVPRQKLSA